ncbi:hypothetical protein B6A10_10130 [Flavobacterium sp. L1I52]|uniref:DUF262 domain-containing protein n=1 Tax=Flavobacterium pokkalii TaxID=1940408 RepID=A0ABR7URJ6_9FLAO|nr:DUF262 domain-containing protein [Flavobacterium pokkalii]MBD0725536.1 hypothetical protein [Flavobacterium pokkalii]
MAIEVTGKQIASDKITIKDVFGEDMWFTIPDYQRPYVWGEDQISTLLDDVSHAAVNTPDSQYFLGSLVLHCESKTLKGTSYTENSVLDGQQRLTTLYILQAVLRDITTSETRKATCAKAIFQEGNPDDGIPERLRIEFAIREEVEKFINQFVKEKGGTLKTEELQHIANTSKEVSIRNMANAILIINRWFSDEDNLDIDTFFPYLRQYVILVYVASSELEDAFRLFTVLNDRGIKLRNSDILKAQNLKEVSTQEKQTKYAKFWEELEGELGEDFDLFLSYIRTILVKEKARNNLLKEFEDNIYHPKKFNHSTKKYEKSQPLLKKGDETFELIKAYKVHYDAVFSGSNHHINNNWAFDNLISILNDTALSDIWIPPLLVYRHNFGEEKIFEFLKLLDNKFSGDWIGRATPTTRIEAMNNIIKKVEELANDNKKSKEEKLEVLFNDNVFNFNTSFFLSDLDENSIYGRRFARYKLRKVDFLLDAPLYSEKRSSYNEMTVEHILPQNPEEGSQWTRDFTQSEREEWTHKLGNLVLISRRKNAGQGRLDFEDKKKKYFTSSIETFPNSIRIMQKPQWTIKELEKNHNDLIAKIKSHYNI